MAFLYFVWRATKLTIMPFDVHSIIKHPMVMKWISTRVQGTRYAKNNELVYCANMMNFASMIRIIIRYLCTRVGALVATITELISNSGTANDPRLAVIAQGNNNIHIYRFNVYLPCIQYVCIYTSLAYMLRSIGEAAVFHACGVPIYVRLAVYV